MPKIERRKPLATPWQRKWLDMEVTHPDLQVAADATAKFCGRWFRNEPWKRLLVLYGETGCGKTHIAQRVSGWAQACAFQRFLEQRSSTAVSVPSVIFQSFAEAADPEQMGADEFRNWMRDINEASMLVLDDIGAETDRFKSGIPTSRLCEVLNRRAGKFTLLTTNVEPSKWREMWDARAEDRLNRDSLVIEMKTPSFTNFS